MRFALLIAVLFLGGAGLGAGARCGNAEAAALPST